MHQLALNSNGRTQGSKIRSHYLSSWFAVDFLAIVPADQVVKIIAVSTGSKTLESWVTTIRLSRLLRILRSVCQCHCVWSVCV